MQFFVSMLLLASVLLAQKKMVEVTFRVETIELPDSEKVYIAGGHTKLGSWKPNYTEFTKINPTTWERKIEFESGKTIDFKFTKGSWDTEALNDDLTLPQNSTLKIEKDTIFFVKINKWRDQGIATPSFTGQITGRVKYHPNFSYEGLLDRDIIVWLPPGYDEKTEERYPVLYMHDGQNIIDPSTSTLGIDWQVDEVADSLIKANLIEPIIIVGLNNTDSRYADYSYSDTGYVYMDFLVNKVKPFIDQNYRTKTDRENTAVAGSSMGGLISFMILWEHNDVFSKAICMSPAFKVSNQRISFNYIERIFDKDKSKRDINLYIDNGGVGIEEQIQPGVYEMMGVLLTEGYIPNKDFHWYFDKEAQHNEAAWAARIHKPLQLFFGK